MSQPMQISPETLIAPDIQAQQMQLARQQQMIDYLRQQSLEQGDTQVINGWAIPKSPVLGLAKMLQGYMAGSQQGDVDKKNIELSKALAGRLSAVMGGGATDPSIASPAALTQGAMSGDIGPTNTNAQRMDTIQAQGNGTAPQSNFGMANLLRGNIAAQLGGPAAGTAYWEQFKPTDLERNMRFGHVDPNSPLGQNAITNSILPMTEATKLAIAANVDPAQANQEALHKAIYIPPTRLGEANFYDPVSGVQGLPTAPAPGFMNVKDANGNWSTVPINNGLNSLSASEGAKTSAESANKIIMVKNAVGAEVPVWAGAAAGAAPGQSQTQPPGRPQGQATNPPQRATQPVQKSNDIWSTIPKMPVPQGLGQSTFNQTTQQEAGKMVATLSEKYGTQAAEANQRKALNMQALDLIDKADTGPQAGNIAEVKNWLVSRFGVPESDFQNTPSATIALQKDLVNAATAKAKQQFGARITQSEVNLMLSRGSPNVDMTKAAMKYLVTSDNAAADFHIQQANDLGKYIQMGGDPYRFEAWYSQKFPMSNALNQVHLNTAPATTPAQTGPVRINNDADYSKLPSGASYIAPDGSTRTKR